MLSEYTPFFEDFRFNVLSTTSRIKAKSRQVLVTFLVLAIFNVSLQVSNALRFLFDSEKWWVTPLALMYILLYECLVKVLILQSIVLERRFSPRSYFSDLLVKFPKYIVTNLLVLLLVAVFVTVGSFVLALPGLIFKTDSVVYIVIYMSVLALLGIAWFLRYIIAINIPIIDSKLYAIRAMRLGTKIFKRKRKNIYLYALVFSSVTIIQIVVSYFLEIGIIGAIFLSLVKSAVQVVGSTFLLIYIDLSLRMIEIHDIDLIA